MKHTCTRLKIALGIISLILSICCLSSCGGGALEIGFSRFTHLPQIMEAVKSDRSDFNINDVTLDFYYGGEASEYSDDDDRVSVGVALYFCNQEAYRAIEFDTLYDDYTNVEGLFFAGFISTEDFNSGEYSVDVSRLGKVTFKHHEALTVPADVFIEDDDHFGFAALEIYSYKNQAGYYFNFCECLTIKYEFSDSQNVRLSKPNHAFLIIK